MVGGIPGVNVGFSGNPSDSRSPLGTLAFCGLVNRPLNNDVTGAFLPEALHFMERRSAILERIDNTQSSDHMRARILESLHKHAPLIHVAIFCHGWSSGIQFGFGRLDIQELAGHLAQTMRGSEISPAVITLYCCSTAMGLAGSVGGDGSFADLLRDQCCMHGLRYCRIDAHDRKGHTTMNPFVRRFEGDGLAMGGTGGQWIVQPGSLLWKTWAAQIGDPGNKKDYAGNFRFDFPRLSTQEIQNQIRGPDHEQFLNTADLRGVI